MLWDWCSDNGSTRQLQATALHMLVRSRSAMCITSLMWLLLHCRSLLRERVVSVRPLCLTPDMAVLLLLLVDGTQLVIKGCSAKYAQAGEDQVRTMVAGCLFFACMGQQQKQLCSQHAVSGFIAVRFSCCWQW